MPTDRHPELLVTPLLERELGATPTLDDIEQWRRRVTTAASPSTVLGALQARFDGLTVTHGSVRATLRWFGSAVLLGERCLFVLAELSTPGAHVVALELERGHDRGLGVPVSPEATARMEAALREAVEPFADGTLGPESFLGTLGDLLRDLPARLAAPAPTESLGAWVLEDGVAMLSGNVAEAPLARGQRLSVHVHRGDSPFQPAKDGQWFAPMIEIRRTSAKGKILGTTEQQVFLGFLGADTLFEPLPDADRRRAALDVLGRWRTELERRIARLPSSEVKSLVPTDLPWPTAPLGLAVQALRHGPPGPRTSAGHLGPRAHETAQALRELDDTEVASLDVPDAVRGYVAGAYTLLVRRREDGDDGLVEEGLWMRRGTDDFLPVVFWLDEDREAFSADGDEPTYRLFSDWLRGALVDGGYDRALPNGVLPSDWLLLQDRDGEPLDHRVAEGRVSGTGYAEVDGLLGLEEEEATEVSTRASELFRALVRELIDPDARFGQKVAELGLP